MSKLIFFVDDDKMMLNLLEYTLKNRQDYEIRTFLNGQECLENLGANPDMIVLDLKFSENGKENMNGLDILKKIKKENEKFPVVILSNHEDEKLRKELEENGAFRFIAKNDYFIDTIMELIDNEI